MADTQIQHLADFLKAFLNAAAPAGVVVCDGLYPYKLPSGASIARHPCLELYREREDFAGRGNRSQRIRNVTVRCNYYYGPVETAKLDTYGGYLSTIVQLVDDALEHGSLATYHSGDNLYEIAGIESIQLKSVEYDYSETGGPLDDGHPACSMLIEMVHRYTRPTDGNEPLARIDGSLIGAGWQAGITSGSLSADTSVLDGANGQIVAATHAFTSATAAFTASHVNWYIRVADAVNPGNNGSHLITARVSGTQVTLGSATTLVNEGPGLHWVLVETP